MAFSVEVEEWVGGIWHRFITRRASPEFPEARVELTDMQRSLAMLFRALGGASGVELAAASARELLLRRNLLQQIAAPASRPRWLGAIPATCACRPAWRCIRTPT